MRSGLDTAVEREAYLIPGDDGTWEGSYLTLLPGKDSTEKCQPIVTLLNHPRLLSRKAIRSHAAVGNCEVKRDSMIIGCE